MHILMVAPEPFFRPRGTPFSVLHRIRGLAMLGHTVDLATYPFGASPEVPGLRIHRAGRVPFVGDVGIGPSVAKALLDVPLFRLTRRLVRERAYDLIHTHEEAGWLGAHLRKRTGIPHLYDMHSSLPQQLVNFGRIEAPILAPVFRRLEAYTLGGADGVIAICQELYDQVKASGYRRPVAMIENTLDYPNEPVTVDAVAEMRSRLALGDSAVVMYTGTLEPYQGLDLLVSAAAQVRTQRPGVAIVIVGGTPAQSAALRRQAEGAGVAEVFRWVPAVPPGEVARYLALADVLVTTRARGTNTPLKIYQYLRAGRPIVATAIRAHTQVLDDDLACLVAATPVAIADGIVRVLADTMLGRRLAEASARAARERYSGAQYLARLDALLRAVVPGARPA